MRRSTNKLIGYTIRATDGELGKVDDFYFDDHSWTIRYLVVNTGGWLSGRRVLIAAAALGQPEWESRTFPVNLTRDQVRNSPSTDTDMPVSRQHEIELHSYYEWPIYWNSCIWGSNIEMFSPTPRTPSPVPLEPNSTAPQSSADPHLRSTHVITYYRIHATDGDIGHVNDFIVNDQTWSIGYLVVDTRNWLPGRRVLVSPQWIKSVSWEEAKVFVDLSRETVRESPVFDPATPISTDYEGWLFDYYGRLRK